ncbi:hypothetical protein Q7P37_000984 [Cladosporium fusiforme]
MATIIPIQTLDTSVDPPKGSSINAVVTLLWPYSSSTRQCALLLSERDFRLRARGGQIRVKFSGPAARTIAERRLGIGDEVVLQLESGKWVRDEGGNAVHVPGRSIGELEYGRGVQLRIQKEGMDNVDISVAEDAVDEVEEERIRVHTPPAKRMSPPTSASNFRSRFGGTPASAAIYSSPAFMRKAAKFNYLDGISRLFEDEWENQDLPRKKARTSIGGVRDWKIVDRTPSPEPSPLRSNAAIDVQMEEADREAEEDIDQDAGTEAEIPPTSDFGQAAELGTASSSSVPVQEEISAPTPPAVDSGADDQITETTAPTLDVPESFVTQADEPAASPPQLNLPPRSPSPVQRQSEDNSLKLVDPSTPRLLPLSSATLPSTTPQISPLATKSGLGSQLSNESVDVVGSTQEAELSSADAHDEAAERMPTPPDEIEEESNGPNELADDTSRPTVESAVVIDESEQVSSDEDVEVVPQIQTAEQVAESDDDGDAASDNLMEDDDEDEDDDMIMHEDDAEDVFDADALDGEDPQDDDSDEDVEMLQTSEKSQQLPQEIEESDESDPEVEESLTIQDPAMGEVISQPREITPEHEERQQPTFVPASTLLQTKESSTKELAPEFVMEEAAATTPPPKKPAFGLDGTIASTEVTPAAKSTDTPKTTPQSARDRVMKRTLQSLFGLKGTPSPEKEDLPAADSAEEVAAATKEESKMSDHAQEAVTQPSSPESTQMPEAPSVEHEAEQAQAVDHSVSAQEPVELIELDSSSEDEEPIHEGITEIAELDYTPSKPRGPGPVPQKGNAAQIEAASQAAQNDSEASAGSHVNDHAQEPQVLDEEDPDKQAQANLAAPSQEAKNLQELDAVMHTPEEAEASVPLDVESQEHQSLGIFEDLEDIPGQDVDLDMQVDDRGTRPEIPESLEAPATAENVAMESETASAAGLVDVDLLNVAEPKATDVEMIDGQPDESLTAVEAEGNVMEMIGTEQERASSPASFQSQIIDNTNEAREHTKMEHESPLASEDAMEDFSPVVLGSFSKRVSELVSDEATAERLRELESGDVEVVDVDEQVLETPSHGLIAGQQDEVAHLSEAEQTPSRSAKQSTVIDLESSPSGLEEFSPVKITQSSQVEGNTPHSDGKQVDKAMADEGPQALSVDGEAEAQARDRQLQADFSDEASVHMSEDIAQAEAEQRRQQLMGSDAEQPALPLTPNLTQSAKTEALLPQQSDKAQAAALIQPTPVTSQVQQETQSSVKRMSTNVTEIAQVHEQPQEKSTMSPAQPLPPKTPARKSLRSRLSNVPDVISAWFSPKRSSNALQETEKPTEHTEAAPTEPTEKAPTPRVQGDGLSTAHSYFASLCNLDQHLNSSSQQAYGNPGIVDVLAVVTNSAKAPQRAKGGPRDYYTIFQIADPNMPASSRVRVEVFRPWKAVLPAADVGDVVLLRAFVVKSRKRTPYLLSTDASGWCVWRFVEHDKNGAEIGDNEDDKPVWARRMSHGDVREEVKGPPVEYGSAEKAQARKLRAWWLARQDEGSEAQAENGLEEDTSAVEL